MENQRWTNSKCGLCQADFMRFTKKAEIGFYLAHMGHTSKRLKRIEGSALTWQRFYVWLFFPWLFSLNCLKSQNSGFTAAFLLRSIALYLGFRALFFCLWSRYTNKEKDKLQNPIQHPYTPIWKTVYPMPNSIENGICVLSHLFAILSAFL